MDSKLKGHIVLFLFLCYNEIGGKMKIAIDKESLSAYKENENEYIYLFYDETYEELKRLGLHCVRWNRCEYVDINLTQYDLDCFKKAKITDPDYDKLPEKVNYKIGIIIPNYNYEHTIEKCLTSIFKQTYTNYEIIFVDDCSTDNSVEIAKQLYSDLLLTDGDFGTLKIVELKQKRLNGGARNEAYLHLSDDVDYVWYVDSDDWLIDDQVLEKINNKLQKKPDVLFVGIITYRRGTLKTEDIPRYINKYQAIEGWSGSCGKVIKKELATRPECLYNEGTLMEDRNQHYKICFYMKDFALLKEPVYVWNRDNPKSVTTVRDKALWGTSVIRNYADALQFYITIQGKDNRIDNIMEKRLSKCKETMLSEKDGQY